ncbi:MAG: PIN domain nuclease [Cytophagales bacterium]
MIFDSSVWINFFRGVRSESTQLLDEQLLDYGADVHLCPPIFQEILQGLRSEDNPESIKDLLMTSSLLQLDPYFVADNAAAIYRSLRTKGITIRKPNDCIIAFYAIHFNLVLVHSDFDFDKIAKHTALKVYNTKK